MANKVAEAMSAPLTRLEQLRRERFLSRADLAKQTGVSVGTIRRLEERLGGSWIDTQRKLCEFFDLSADDLLGEPIHVAQEPEAA